MKKIVSLAAAAALLYACNNTGNSNNGTASDSAKTVKHNVPAPAFNAISDSSKLQVAQLNGKSINYKDYVALFPQESETIKPEFLAKDIDKDGNNEMVINYYTGGAHCCEVTAILARTGENSMKEVLNFTGGTIINNDTVWLSFEEALGYFNTCYACNIDYVEYMPAQASFVFSNGKFSPVATQASLNIAINKNLTAIAAKGIPDKDSKDESGFDDGTRKAVAQNITAYYFNNGQDIKAAQQLFDKYYKHADKAAVWKQLGESLSFFTEDIKKGVALQ